MQAILFSPAALDDAIIASLKEATLSGAVAAIILRREQNEIPEAYAKRVKSFIEPLQVAGAAVLLDAMPELVKKLKADGVHMISGQRQFAEALDALKPDYIVGAGDVRSDHEAMLRGESGADYVLFGDPDRAATDEEFEKAQWWAQTVQVDGALCADQEQLDQAFATNVQFIALGSDYWASNSKTDILNKILAHEVVEED